MLLNTYFKLIYVPIIERLEELLNSDQYLIASTTNTLENLKYYEVFDESQYEILKKKKMKYEKNSNLKTRPEAIMEETTFNDMMEGKVVILLNSYAIDFYLKYYNKYRDKFIVSEYKYIRQQYHHVINKGSPILKQQLFGFVSD